MDRPKEIDFLIIPIMKRRMLKVSLLPFFVLFFLLGSAYSSSQSTKETLPKRSWWIDMGKFLSSSHGGLSCSECHADIEEKGVKHPDPKLLGRVSTLLFDYKKCEKCHPQEYQRYLKGAHAKVLVERKKDAPTCGNCHVTHYVLSGRSRLELGKWMTEICGTCHPIQKRTYLENYHGKTAALLEYEASAYCTDCHGAHTCLSLKKKEDALEACQKCHPNAKLRFTGFVIHASEEGVKKEDVERLEKIRIIRWIEVGFGILVFGVLAFFYSHTLVWTLRKVHEWLKRE
jgi:ribosomal protein L31